MVIFAILWIVDEAMWKIEFLAKFAKRNIGRFNGQKNGDFEVRNLEKILYFKLKISLKT